MFLFSEEHLQYDNVIDENLLNEALLFSEKMLNGDGIIEVLLEQKMSEEELREEISNLDKEMKKNKKKVIAKRNTNKVLGWIAIGFFILMMASALGAIVFSSLGLVTLGLIAFNFVMILSIIGKIDEKKRRSIIKKSSKYKKELIALKKVTDNKSIIAKIEKIEKTIDEIEKERY